MQEHLDQVGVTDHWMQTYTGVKFTPLSPRLDDINIDDIAHALSLQCRYAGHCKAFYSVAQHSVLVASILPEQFKLEGLLHDAAEAYLQDMIRPLKVTEFGDLYVACEERLMRAIAEKFELVYPFPAEVKLADNAVLFTEKRDLITVQHEWQGESLYRSRLLTLPILPWPAQMAEEQFKQGFRLLKLKRDRMNDQA